MTGRVENAMLHPEVTVPFIERPAALLEQRVLDPETDGDAAIPVVGKAGEGLGFASPAAPDEGDDGGD